MRMSTLAAKNLLRNKVRTILTVLAVIAIVFTFMALRTVITAWQVGEDHGAKDRIATRHKVSMIMPLPMNYVTKLRQNRDRDGNELGLETVSYGSWFGGKHPQRETEFFATIAVDPPTFLKVYHDIVVTPEEAEVFLANRRGAIVGDVLARKFGWEVGQKVTLEGTIYAGNWDFEIVGIYTAKRKAVDRMSFFFHWEYLNESIKGPDKDKVGWIISRFDQPERTAEISRKIDQLFETESDLTLSMSERQMQMSFMGMLSAVLTAINAVSMVLMLIMTLILGNAIAMGVRERTGEYGVLRAIGFMPRHLVMFIVGESMFVGLIGGLIGTGLGYMMINGGIGPFLEENMGALFPYFRVETSTLVWAVGLSVLLGALAAAIPAYRASKLEVVTAIRRVG